ncbi:MAG: FkbM family methyltransferase [Hyphomicrobiales bacterium]
MAVDQAAQQTSKQSSPMESIQPQPEPQPWGTFAPSAVVARLRAFSSAQGSNYLGKRLAFLARKIAMGMMNGALDVEVFGHKLRIEPYANLAEKRVLFTPQYFDPVERDWLARYLPADAIFIDIGANVGAYSFYAAQCAGQQGRILAIEPQPAVYQRLCENISFNLGVPIEAIPLAIADVDGPIQLFVDRNNAGETSMRRIGSDGAHGVTLEVQAKPLATLLADRELPRVDALKIDVEGAEDLILVPFFDTAPKALWPTLVIIENSPESWHTDCIALMHAKGYTSVAETRLNIVLTRAPDY